MRSRVVSVFSDAIASANVPVFDVAARYQELGDALLPLINPAMTAKYGLEIPSFIVENVSVPAEVEKAIDKRSSMSAIGNLNDYVKFQMAESMTKGEGGGMAASAAQLGAGIAMGQQIAASMANPQSTSPLGGLGSVPSAGAAGAGAEQGGAGLPQLLSPAEAAQILGVSENDVMQAISEGGLKAKKIGSSHRITRGALDEFLNS